MSRRERSLEAEAKAESREVANWLLYIEEREAKYRQRREDALSLPAVQYDRVGGRGGGVSDPTAEAAIAAADPETEAWIDLIHEVERRLPLKMQVFLRLRRKYRHNVGRRGWVAQIQHEFADEMSRITGKEVEVLWVDSRTTFYAWWERIVNYAARLAAKRGLLK